MKWLLVVRHAKAEQAAEGNGDFGRELTRAGVDAAEALGVGLAAAGIVPDLLYTSAAPRAFQTASILAGAVGLPPDRIESDRTFYSVEAKELIEAFREVSDRVTVLAVCGHNPAMTDFVHALDREISIELKTASAAFLTLDILSWGELSEGRVANVDYFGL
jgi:phosphohistidine phosphatase